MSQREKRVVAKPARYQTTSSEEAGPKKKTATVQKKSIDQDIQDLMTIVQEYNNQSTSKDFFTSNVLMLQNSPCCCQSSRPRNIKGSSRSRDVDCTRHSHSERTVAAPNSARTTSANG